MLRPETRSLRLSGDLRGVLAAIGFSPRGEPLTQAGATRAFGGGEVALLGGVQIQSIQFLGAFAQVVDVLPRAFAHAEPEVILGHVEIRARRAAGVQEAPSPPIRRWRE